jgi:EAL domain-containing protein (putative c-di-GMP-specific phosphodiesterase class I)
LLKAKCDQMQGYLISRPVPRDAVTAMLRAKDASPAT